MFDQFKSFTYLHTGNWFAIAIHWDELYTISSSVLLDFNVFCIYLFVLIFDVIYESCENISDNHFAHNKFPRILGHFRFAEKSPHSIG